jgi:fucose 4-O-acetylase-like acetyltransferase
MQEGQSISSFTSQKIKCWTFIAIVMVVIVHSYNLTDRYLQPWTTPGDALTATSFIEYFISNGITRFIMPLLFCISGYLFSMRDFRPRRQVVKSRLRTIGIPFIFWSAFGIALVYVLELFPYTRSLVAGSQVVQISNDRLLIHDYHWYEILLRWLLVPASYQLWFLQVLLVYNLCYPAMRWCIMHKTARWIFFTIAALLWFATFGGVIIDGEGMLFFSIGIWMQKNNFDIETPGRRLKPLAWGIAFILLCTGKTWLAFNPQSLSPLNAWPLLLIMHKLSQLSGLIAVWYGGNSVVRICMGQRWFVWLTGFSFIIYVMHTPAVAIFINAVFSLLHYGNNYRMLSFILLPLMAIAACVIIGWLLRSIFPKTYSLLTGGRGF